jgi:hypothetical protein
LPRPLAFLYSAAADYMAAQEIHSLLSDTNLMLLPYQVVQVPRSNLQRFGCADISLIDRCLTKSAGFSLPIDGLMSLEAHGDTCLIRFEYCPDILDNANANAIVTTYQKILPQLLKTTDRPLKDFAY